MRFLFWAAIVAGAGGWAVMIFNEIGTTIDGTINILQWGLIVLLGFLLVTMVVVASPLMVNRKKDRR